jgi:hypothetical protein
MNGTIDKTAGGLSKRHLRKNKRGRIVSVAKSHPVGSLSANQFFCVGCQRKTTAMDGAVRRAKAKVTGQPMLKASCNHCGGKVCKFVSA